MRSWIFAAALALPSSGCIAGALETVGPVSNPAEFIAEERPSQVEAVMADGTKYVLERPSIVEDSLEGWDFLAQREVSLPFSQVQRVEAVRIDPFRLRVAIAAGALLVGGLTYAWLSGGEDDAPWCVLNVPYGLECGPAPPDASVFQIRVPVPW